jgi:4-hydroxy-L-threonine phosphate dehydrogenase PdxA
VREYGAADDVDWNASGVKLLTLGLLGGETLALGQIRAAHGRAALGAAKAAIDAALAGHVTAVVAAPHNETAIKQAGIVFDGYPGFLAQCTGHAADDAYLMLCFDDMRIAHMTLHVPLARALALVTQERVGRVITATAAALDGMGIDHPRIAVAGVNPHAGEAGLFGDEEIRLIGPAIAAARQRGIGAEGPFGADTMLGMTGIDAFIVMYHDQGHIAAKLLAPNRAAALTIGTEVPFASVAHGSALDLAGQNRASPEAMIEAVRRLVGPARHPAA